MALELWEANYLQKMKPFADLDLAASRELVSFFCFQEPADSREARARASTLLFGGEATGTDSATRIFHVGRHQGRTQERRRALKAGKAAGDPAAAVEPGSADKPDVGFEDLDPDLMQFLAEADARAKVARLQELHLDAQVAMLAAIRRQADVCTDEAALRLLADAYMDLPKPGEDFGTDEVGLPPPPDGT